MKNVTRSLALKISTAIVLMESLVLGCLGYYYVSRFSAQVDEQVHTQITIPGILMQEQALRYPAVRDISAIKRLLQEDVVHALVLQRSGMIFYAQNPDDEGRHVASMIGRAFPFDLSSPIRQTRILNTLQHGTPQVASLTPLFSGTKHIGYLYLQIDMTRAQDAKRDLAVNYALMTALCIMLTSLTEILLIHHIVKPRILSTVQCLRQAEEGNLGARIAAPESGDEIGQLQRDVNAMLERIEMRTRAREEAEKRLRANEENLRVLLQSIGDAVIATDDTGRIQRMNPMAETLTGWTEAEAAGVDLDTVLRIENERTGDPAESPHRRVIETGEIIGLANHTILIARDGSRHPIADSAAPMYNDSGDLIGVVLVFRDQTREREAQRVLERSKEDLETLVKERTADLTETAAQLKQEMEERQRMEAMVIRAERLSAVGTLASGVAHEFNNINVSVLGFAELGLELDDISETVRKYFDSIRRAGWRAKRITRNLLTFTRARKSSREGADLCEVVEESIQLVRHELENSGVRIIRQLEKTPLSVMDRALIGQVVVNLLINAHHAMIDRPEKCLTVSCGVEGEWLVLRISDTGCGMSPETQRQIFTPFFSTKGEHSTGDSTQSRVRGTGLGLSVCHTIIEGHDGEINLTSTEGEGSTFIIRLPVSPPAETVAEKVYSVQASSAPSGLRVVVLDDEETVGEFVKQVFRKDDIDITWTKNAEEAVDACCSNRVDVLLLDLLMPDSDGLSVLGQLQECGCLSMVRVIVISGLIDEDEERQLHDYKVHGILNKPFSADDLRQAVFSSQPKED